MWTQIRSSLIKVHNVYEKATETFQQMSISDKFVVIGALREYNFVTGDLFWWGWRRLNSLRNRDHIFEVHD